MSESRLTSSDFTEENEPFTLFAAWLQDATASEINDPNGMALATVNETLNFYLFQNGQPATTEFRDVVVAQIRSRVERSAPPTRPGTATNREG